MKYLQTSFNCPVCDVEVHKTKPLSHIRCVYKSQSCEACVKCNQFLYLSHYSIAGNILLLLSLLSLLQAFTGVRNIVLKVQ